MGAIKGILAGVLVTLGGRVYIAVYSMNDTYGKIIGAILFSLGLLTILLYKLPLFTGRVGYMEINNTKSVTNTLKVLIQNILGCIIAGYGIYRISSNEQLELINTMIEIKISTGIINTLILAIFCGGLMFIAVDSYHKTTGIIVPILCVSVFILSGFEHCIANVGYIVEWGIMQLTNGKLTLDNLSRLSISLITVIVGNSVGAIVTHRIMTTGSVHVDKTKRP